MAICLHVAESLPAAKLLPEDPKLRALCYSAISEMHSGFVALRTNMPMNCCVISRKRGLEVSNLNQFDNLIILHLFNI